MGSNRDLLKENEKADWKFEVKKWKFKAVLNSKIHILNLNFILSQTFTLPSLKKHNSSSSRSFWLSTHIYFGGKSQLEKPASGGLWRNCNVWSFLDSRRVYNFVWAKSCKELSKVRSSNRNICRKQQRKASVERFVHVSLRLKLRFWVWTFFLFASVTCLCKNKLFFLAISMFIWWSCSSTRSSKESGSSWTLRSPERCVESEITAATCPPATSSLQAVCSWWVWGSWTSEYLKVVQ